MGLFGWGEEAEGIGKGVSNVTSGLRHLITGDQPPEVVQELARLDSVFSLALIEAEKGIPWYLSSRSIVMMWLVLNTTIMMWASVFTDVAFEKYWVEMLGFLTTSAVVAFFGSKGAEFWRQGRMV